MTPTDPHPVRPSYTPAPPQGVSAVAPRVVYVAFAGYVALINGTLVRYMAPSPNGGASVGFAAPGFLLTTGVADGAAVYAMGLSGTL